MVNLCLAGYPSIFYLVDSFISDWHSRVRFESVIRKVVRAAWRMDMDGGSDASIRYVFLTRVQSPRLTRIGQMF